MKQRTTKRNQHSKPATDSPRPRPSAHPALVSGVSVLAIAALAVWIHRHALGAYFTTDDLIHFEIARGLSSESPTLWRALSRFAYYRFAMPLFGIEPVPYHVVSLFLHATTCGLLFAWVRVRGGALSSAWLAAALLATSSLFVTVVWQVSAIGELLAAAFTLGALIECERTGRRARTLSILFFAAALVSKENVALVPLAALIPVRSGERIRERWARVVPLLALGVAMMGYVLLARAGLGSLGGTAYRAGFGAHMVDHLLVYAAWSVGAGPDLPAVSTRLIGASALVLLAAMSALAFRRSRLPAVGALVWLAALVPVLPLEHQRYVHYLYVPFVGAAVAFAAGVEWLAAMALARAKPTRAVRLAWGLAVVLVLVHSMAAERTIERLRSARIAALDLPLDSMLRKMEFIQNFSRDLAVALGHEPARVLVLSPPETERMYSVRSGRRTEHAPAGIPRYDFMTETLHHGRGVQALFPRVESIQFADHWSPDFRDHLLTTNSVNGHLEAFGRGPQALAAMASSWARRGLGPQALTLLDEARGTWSDNPDLTLVRGAVNLRWGSPEAGRQDLESLVRQSPGSPAAAAAEAILDRIQVGVRSP